MCLRGEGGTCGDYEHKFRDTATVESAFERKHDNKISVPFLLSASLGPMDGLKEGKRISTAAQARVLFLWVPPNLL